MGWLQAWKQGSDRVSQTDPHHFRVQATSLHFYPLWGLLRSQTKAWGGTLLRVLGGNRSQRLACPNALAPPQEGGDGETGEGEGMRCHFQGCPCTLTLEEQAGEALADPSYRHRQTETQTAHSDSIDSGNFGSQNPYIFHKKRNRFWHLCSRNRN